MEVDLQSVLKYCGKELVSDPKYVLWSVFITEWVANIAEFFLQEVYNNFRLCSVPIKVRVMIRYMYLQFVLASQYNQTDLCRILDVIDNKDFSAVTIDQAHRGNLRVDDSYDRTNCSGKYFRYNPYRRCVVYQVSHRSESMPESPNPSGYPTGFSFVASDSAAKEITEANIGVVTMIPGYAVVDVGVVNSVPSPGVLKNDAYVAVNQLFSSIGKSCDGIATIYQAIDRLNTHLDSRTETTVTLLVANVDEMIYVLVYVLDLIEDVVQSLDPSS